MSNEPRKPSAPAPPSTSRLVFAMMAKGGVYALLSLVMWPGLAVFLTGAPPFGAGADRLAAVFGVLGAAFASAACLAFVVSRPRVREPRLRRLMGIGTAFSAFLLVVQLAVSVDVIRRNLPAPTADSTVERPPQPDASTPAASVPPGSEPTVAPE